MSYRIQLAAGSRLGGSLFRTLWKWRHAGIGVGDRVMLLFDSVFQREPHHDQSRLDVRQGRSAAARGPKDPRGGLEVVAGGNSNDCKWSISLVCPGA